MNRPSFTSVFIAVFLGTALVVGALLLHRQRPEMDTEQPSASFVRAVVPNDHPVIEVTIRDNGPGFSPNQMHRVFSPFYTTKPKGTGLGMAIAQRVVEAHGGRIIVAVRQHSGANIEIVLPRS